MKTCALPKPMPQKFRAALLVAAGLVCAASAQGQGAGPAGDAVNGKRVYMAVGCYQCHGTVGQGSRPTGPHIAPDPVPYEAFAGMVRHPRNVMPPYTAVVLPDRDLGDIYAYLLTIPPLIDPKAAPILDH
jgi:mono/diheme cytochrome c family protein